MILFTKTKNESMVSTLTSGGLSTDELAISGGKWPREAGITRGKLAG